jgi:hypothetical protein
MSIHHDQIVRTMLRSLKPGCAIVTADGEQIGTLAEVADEAVKVDAPLRRDFWIDAAYVRSCDEGRVELSFLKQDLGAYRLDSYRHGDISQPDDPVAEGKIDHVLSDAEQMETRLRMERELAAQRQELPHLHPRGEAGPPDTFGTIGEPVEAELERHGIDPVASQVPEYAEAERHAARSYWPFIVLAAAVIPVAAGAYWLRARRS